MYLLSFKGLGKEVEINVYDLLDNGHKTYLNQDTFQRNYNSIGTRGVLGLSEAYGYPNNYQKFFYLNYCNFIIFYYVVCFLFLYSLLNNANDYSNTFIFPNELYFSITKFGFFLELSYICSRNIVQKDDVLHLVRNDTTKEHNLSLHLF